MQQASLDLQPPRARRRDPETSKAAAVVAKKFQRGHAAKALAALRAHGPQTAHELFTYTGLSVVQLDRRLPELCKAGLIRVQTLHDGAEVVRGNCRVWEAVGAV